jgi:hypothetical protein
MGRAVVCHGCGKRLDVPDDYGRNKMQCPECGVYCPVPAGPAPEKKKTRAKAEAEEEPRIDVDEPAVAAPPAPAPPPRADRPTETPGAAACPHCGELVPVPPRRKGQRRACPACGGEWAAPAKAKPAPAAAPPPPPLRTVNEKLTAPDDDPETSNPYLVADRGRRVCPGCNDEIEPEAVLCVRCGYDLRTGRKVVKTYKPIDVSWDSGMPLRWRLIAFASAMGLALVVFGLFAILVTEQGWAFVPPWLVFGAMMSFLFGTYDRLALRRNRSGETSLTKTWRFCFVPVRPSVIDVHAYEGVLSGRAHSGGCWEWTVFLALLPLGLVPSAVWWYFAIYRIVYYVALCRDHGSPEVILYRGWSEARMHEVARTVRDAGGLAPA